MTMIVPDLELETTMVVPNLLHQMCKVASSHLTQDDVAHLDLRKVQNGNKRLLLAVANAGRH